MGVILSSKVKDDGKVVFEIAVEPEEAIQLKGHLSGIHLFTENVIDSVLSLSTRGKNDATKYFLVPKGLRDDIKTDARALCQKIETKTNIIFIYVINKSGL